MQNLTSYIASDGTKYHIPADKEAEFKADFGEDAQPAVRYRTKDGQGYTIPTSEIENFRVDFPDAEPTRRVSFADGSTRDFTMPELSKFLRSPEWREGEQFKADRDERDRAVNAKMGGDGEMHSPTWAAIKGGLKGAAQGFWQGGNAAANKIAKAIPEIGISLESALGNAINLGGNAPNAVGNWFLADAKSGKAWLDAHLPDSVKDWTGYEDWSTKTADKFAEVSAMGYKFAPAMATGGSTALVNTMFASDGLNAAANTFDNAMQSGYTQTEANAAAAASFLVNYYGAKLVTKAGGVADSFKNPILHQLGAASGVGTTMGVQSAANRGIENVTGGRIDETTGFPDRKIRPLTEGMGEAFAEGATEGILFHAINAIPGAVVGGANMAAQRMRETREMKEYRKDSLLAVARGEDGGELLDTLLPTRGLDAAIRARKGGADVSRKMAQGADLPDNMSVAERNEVIDAIIKARGELAAQNRVRPDEIQSRALDEAIAEVGGVADWEAVREKVLSKIGDAKELDDPKRREELVGEAFEEWNKEHPKEKPNETGNVPDEKPAQPKPPVETRAEGAEAVRPVEGEPPRGEAPRPDVVKPAEKPKEPPQGSQEPPAPPKTGEDTPKPAEGVEAASRASDANGDWTPPRPALLEKGNEKRFSDGDKVVGWRRIYNPGITTPKTEDVNGVFMGMSPEGEALIRTEKGSYVRVDPRTLKTPEEFAEDAAKNKAQNSAIAKRMTEGVIPKEEIDRLLGMSPEDIAKADIKFEQPAKPVPDGKGKMVKPAPTEPPKTTAPVVDETGKTAEVAPPDSVEAKISAMKRGSPEQLKAQKEYFETEIAKAEEAIKGKLDEPTKKKVGSKWVNEWKPKKDAGEVPPSVTIKIPGDGEFTVPNNPDGIARLKMVAAKFKAAPKKGKVETDSIPRGPSLKPAEKPKIESAEKETALFVSDGKREPLRKSVSKPFSDGEYVYATDGRMLVRRPLRKGEKVNGEKDAPIDATHKVIKEATANRENDTKIKASVSELYPKLIQAGVIADLRPDYLKKGAIQLWQGSDGKLQIRTRDDAGNEYFTDGLSKSSKPLAQIQGEYLQNFLKLVAKSGGGEIEISVKDAESPLLLKGGGWDAVLMPLRTDNSPKSSPASKAKKPASDIQPQKPLAEVRGKNAEQAEFELPKQPPTPQNAARNPKALKDPNFVKWAKKHGRTPTPFARREYDRQKIEAAVPLYQRIFPGMKIKIHDKVEDPAKWTKDHPDGTLKLIRAKSGEVLGWYTPGFKELHLNPGATVETVAHEMLHAAQDWAKANSPELARALDNIARDCPRALKQRILRTYGAISPEAIMKEWGAFNFMGGEMGGKGKGGKAILDELARRENMTWAGKFWTAVKDIWKSMAAKMGGNRIDLSAIDSKTPQEAMDFLARAFAEGKTLGKMPKVGKTPRPAIDMTRKLTAKEKWEVNLHNYRDPLKVLLDDMVERGAKFDDSNNFYEASRLQKGFDQAAVNDANRRMAEYTKMCKEKGVTHDEVVEFMQAQAAKDRNAMILQRNGKLDGSAMSDKVAAKTLRAFEDAGKGDALREISDYLLAMQAEGLQYRVQTGLLSAEAAAEMTKREPKHVPFRSAIDPETGDYIEWGNDHGSFAKAEFQRAEGRQTLAGDVVSWMFDEFIDAHTRGNENTVRKMIADAMRLHPEMGVGKILKGARKTTAHDFQGVVSKVVNNGNKGLLGKKAKVAIVDDPNYRESRRNGDGGRTNVLAFKEGGEAHFIEFAPGERGSRIQAAVNGRDLKSMGKLWQKGMRFWSSTATELSPTFAVRNVIADNIDVFGNYVGEYGAIKGHAAYAKHVKNAAQLTPALMKYIATGKLPQGEMGEWIKRYEKAGGQIAGFANEGYNDIVKKIDLAPKHGIEKGKAIAGAVKDAVLSPVKGINALAELSTRVAAFKTQCELGMTDHKAALWSRESTVDFNMRGNWTGISNGLYMFSNSTLGASARQLKSLFSSKHGWEVAGTFFAYGFAEGALECLMNSDESEREKRGEGTGKDVNEYTRANSVYIRNGDKVYRVPFHAGPFSFIKYIGNCAARNAFGKMKLEDAGKEIGKEAVSQIFHYTGMGSVNFQSQSGKFADDAKTFIGTAVPSIGQNIVQGAFNIDYAGRSIYNEGFPGSTTPRSEQGRPSTPNWASDAAKWLNEKTGGNDARSGYVDLPPEVIKLAGEAVGKNLLRDVMNVGTVIGMTMGDEKVDVRNIPVARDFVRPVSGNDRRFNDALKEYNADTDEYSKKKSTWTREERIAYKKSHPWVDDKTKDTIDEIKKLRKREQGFWYKNGKAKPHEWTQEDLEKFKARRQKLQAFVLEKMGK